MANNCLRSSFHHFLYTCTAIHAFAGEVEKMRHLVLLLMWWFSQCSIIFSLKVLDACSAPGNKTVHLAALMRGKGKIIACELNKERVLRLKETIKLSGASSILLWSFSSFKYHSILFYLFDISFLLQNCWTISNLPTVMSIRDHCDSFLIFYSTMFRSIFFWGQFLIHFHSSKHKMLFFNLDFRYRSSAWRFLKLQSKWFVFFQGKV